jgi:hypothetical protein
MDLSKQIDLTPLLKCMPATLESFTITYHNPVDLEERFTYKDLVRGMIEIGVQFFNFYKVDFGIENNRSLFKSIFSNEKALRGIKYLNFFRCKQIEKVNGVLNNLEGLESLSMVECGLTDNHTDDLKKMLEPYFIGMKLKLKTLTLNHNELNKAKDDISQW